ncbi:MAG: hypothetical protein AMJ43_02780 [Coxiella sp. DG_40]|nr:MAG: hypothetical protein AMJ43_02780 [Coxiella sp. DG_40]
MNKILTSLFVTILLIYSRVGFTQYLSSINLNVNKDINTYIAETNELRPQVLQLAFKAYNCALLKGIKDDKQILTIIDYSLPSSIKRLWIFDLKNKVVLFNTLVAHGIMTGNNKGEAIHFSDQPHSLESSIGLFMTEGSYEGKDGYSLKLKGLEKNFNDEAEQRHIIIHGAWYVSENIVKRYGKIGRSWGCPALDLQIVKPIIDSIKDGTLLFAYFPNPKWLAQSTFLHCPDLKNVHDNNEVQQ